MANVALTQSGDLLVLSSGNVKMKIDPKVSGRVVYFGTNGKNILSGSEIHSFNYGSTFWPSPQSKWGWPPYEALDKKPYSIESQFKNNILLKSKPDSASGLQLRKHFYIKEEQFHIAYTIKNISDSILEAGPWEVSRVDTGGRAFFKEEDKKPLPASSLKNIEIRDGYLWYHYDPETMEKSQKHFGFGEGGYLAYYIRSMLFVKEFPDIEPYEVAPDHGEIEIFANASYPYIELENHGRFERLAPGDSLIYRVKWYLKEVPVNTSEKKLIKLVESITR
jgi:hypothetical protein